MPKIDTSTVAEHHDLHRSRLLDAAIGFVAEHDIESLTLAELAKRTGRSRASLYAYFGSTDEMRIALCEHALTTWVDEVLADISHASTPGERLDRFITTQITRRHGPTVERILAYVLGQQSGPLRAQLRTVTEPLTTELLAIIEQLGVVPPTRAATVVQGAIAAAHDQVHDGADADEVAADTVAFVQAGINALRSSTPSGSHTPPVARRDRRPAVVDDRTHPMPGRLTMRTSPSMPVALAVAMPSTEAARTRTAAPSRTRLAWIAGAQLLWAGIATVSGVTGMGGTPLHVALGLSLVALLAWLVRVTPPLRVATSGLRVALILAIAASAVALVARAQPLEAAVVVHVVLAVALLVGLIRVARSTWHHRRTTILAVSDL